MPYVIHFGPYRGKTLQEVVISDPVYLMETLTRSDLDERAEEIIQGIFGWADKLPRRKRCGCGGPVSAIVFLGSEGEFDEEADLQCKSCAEKTLESNEGAKDYSFRSIFTIYDLSYWGLMQMIRERGLSGPEVKVFVKALASSLALLDKHGKVSRRKVLKSFAAFDKEFDDSGGPESPWTVCSPREDMPAAK